MAVTRVQSKIAGSSGAVASLTATFDSTPDEGNLLLAYGSSFDFLSMTSSGWTLAVSDITSDALYMWYKLAKTSEATAVQVTPDHTESVVLTLEEWNSTTGWMGSPVDKTAVHYTGFGTSCATGTTAATTQAIELAAAYVQTTNTTFGTPSAWNWTDSFVNALQGFGTGSDATKTVYNLTASKELAATGTQTSTAAWSNSQGDSCGVIATFKVAPPPELNYKVPPIRSNTVYRR